MSTPLRTTNTSMFQLGSGNVVLFDIGAYGGEANYLNNAAFWNGTVWTGGTSQSISATGPLPTRTQPTLCYDGYNGFLMGGSGAASGQGLSDIWTITGTTWTKQTATAPAAIYGAKAAYLANYGTVIAGGTYVGGSGQLNYNTLLWNGNTGHKTLTTLTPTVYPPARKNHVMAASPTLVALGFGEGTNSQFQDMWTFNSSGNWTKLSPTNLPSVRSGACLSYDLTNSLWVLNGGTNEYNFLNETWTSSNLLTWTKATGAVQPSGRFGAAMCWDGQSGRTLLFGGIDATNSQANGQTWAFNGSTKIWAQVA